MAKTSRKLDVTYDRELNMLRGLFMLRGRKRAPRKPPKSPSAAAYLALLAEAYGPLPAQSTVAEPPLVEALTFDATGLAALANGDIRARGYLARAVGSLARILVPATALLEPRMAAVANAVAEIVDVDESIARSAERLMANARSSRPLGAIVVACAAREISSGIVTADGAGIGELVRAAGRRELHVFAL